MSETVAEKVIAAIAKTKKLPVESITLDSTLEELRIDSLDGLNLFFDLEEAFDISIPDEQARQLKTVREIVDNLDLLIAGKKQTASIPPTHD